MNAVVKTTPIECAWVRFYKGLIDETAPLVEAHYREIAWRQDVIPLDPDYDRYAAGDTTGAIRIYTARQDGELIGYAVFIVNPHLHYKTTLWAMNDVLYVAEGRRGYRAGSKLLRYAEADLRANGVKVMGLHIKDLHNWGSLAKILGFERVESTWLKWIGG